MLSYDARPTRTDPPSTPPSSASSTPASYGGGATGSVTMIDLVPCPPAHGNVTERFCRDSFGRANTGRRPEPDTPLYRCFRCPHGAARCGVTVRKGLATEQCLQCGVPSSRLIRGRHCPSCYNRRLEWRKGVNARGRYPTCLPPTIRYELTVTVEDRAPTIRAIEAVSLVEAILVAALAGPVTVTHGRIGGRMADAERLRGQ